MWALTKEARERAMEKNNKAMQEVVTTLRKAASSGHARAQYQLGQCYELGNGIEADIQEALRLYQISAVAGDPDAQYTLGHRLADGAGITQSFAEAQKWMEKATESNRYYSLDVPYETLPSTEANELCRLWNTLEQEEDAAAQRLFSSASSTISHTWEHPLILRKERELLELRATLKLQAAARGYLSRAQTRLDRNLMGSSSPESTPPPPLIFSVISKVRLLQDHLFSGSPHLFCYALTSRHFKDAVHTFLDTYPLASDYRLGQSQKLISAISGPYCADLRRLTWAEQISDGQLVFPGPEIFCNAAAKSGHLAALYLLRSWNYPWGPETCARAAGAGKCTVLQWMRANGCEWDSTTCEQAAAEGHLEVLQWAAKSGCELTSKATESAARAGHCHVLEWARENEHMFQDGWTSLLWLLPCAAAAEGGHLRVLQLLRMNCGRCA